MPKVDPDFVKKLTEPEEDDEEGILLGPGEEEVEEETEEELSKYDEKEQEAREEIQGMFLDLVDNMQKIQDSLTHILEKPLVDNRLTAGKYRIEVTEEEMNGLDKMAALNENIITSHIYLKNFIDFGEGGTPKFEYVKNLIFKFQQELNREQSRTYAIVQRRDYGKIYITRRLVTDYLKGIHVHLSRIIGTLKPAGEYLVTVPPRREINRGMGEGGEFMGQGQDIYNGDFEQPQLYANSNDWWNQQSGNNFIRRGTKIKGKPRDFGED